MRIGNKGTDSTEVIKRALKEAEEGETIILSHGKYYIYEPILLEKRINIIGDGNVEIYFMDCDGIDISMPYSTISNIIIRNKYELDEETTGLLISSGRVSARNIRIEGFGGAGISIENVNLSTIENIEVSRCGWGSKENTAGIDVYSSYSLSIRNIYIEKCPYAFNIANTISTSIDNTLINTEKFAKVKNSHNIIFNLINTNGNKYFVEQELSDIIIVNSDNIIGA